LIERYHHYQNLGKWKEGERKGKSKKKDIVNVKTVGYQRLSLLNRNNNNNNDDDDNDKNKNNNNNNNNNKNNNNNQDSSYKAIETGGALSESHFNLLPEKTWCAREREREKEREKEKERERERVRETEREREKI